VTLAVTVIPPQSCDMRERYNTFVGVSVASRRPAATPQATVKSETWHAAHARRPAISGVREKMHRALGTNLALIRAAVVKS